MKKFKYKIKNQSHKEPEVEGFSVNDCFSIRKDNAVWECALDFYQTCSYISKGKTKKEMVKLAENLKAIP